MLRSINKIHDLCTKHVGKHVAIKTEQFYTHHGIVLSAYLIHEAGNRLPRTYQTFNIGSLPECEDCIYSSAIAAHHIDNFGETF